MATETFVSQINGKNIYAARAAASTNGVNIDSKFSELEQAISSMGSYEVVPLTSGTDPVPDVANPSTHVIYLTKDSSSTATDPYTEWIWIPASTSPSVAAHWEIIGETSIDLSGYKTKQSVVSVTGGTLKGVASFSQNANGEVTLTLNDIRTGSTSQTGVLQLEDSHTSTSTTKAATPKNVKEAYDLANGKQDPITFDGTYDASTNKAATVSTVTNAVSPVASDLEELSNLYNGFARSTSQTLNALQKNKADKVSSATEGNFAGLDANGNLTDSGSKASDFKTKQSAVADPTVPSSGTTTATSFIDTITQNANGVITPTKKNLPTATTSAAGIVSLSSATNSTSETVAATSKAVKTAYDLANGKYSKPSGGIPSTDMTTAVQTSLGKADSAIQSVKVNGTALTPDSSKAVNVPVAASSTYGVVTIGTIDL